MTTMQSRYSDPASALASAPAPYLGGATFALRYRLLRLIWSLCWTLLASWTPAPFQPIRSLLLRSFGARIHSTAVVRGSARIWWPANLSMGEHASIGPGVICYNVAPVVLEDYAIVSQRAHLCTASHDIDDPAFPLTSRAIVIGCRAWIASEAFVGPGVKVADGAVLGARAVATRDLDEWKVYAGNPARPIRERRRKDRQN
jgi:putative colanic acid biosynthesis acetyltransferase WcaF